MSRRSNKSSQVEPQRIEREQWYDDGLCFECTQCGNCCTGPPGYVWFTEDEGRAMAREFGLSETEFRSQYARTAYGRWSLRERKTEHGFDCIFLDRQSQPGKALCRVYKARPSQCKSWPFWPENLKTKRSWMLAKQSTPCPGMDNGPLYPAKDIRIIRDSTPKK